MTRDGCSLLTPDRLTVQADRYVETPKLGHTLPIKESLAYIGQARKRCASRNNELEEEFSDADRSRASRVGHPRGLRICERFCSSKKRKADGGAPCPANFQIAWGNIQWLRSARVVWQLLGGPRRLSRGHSGSSYRQNLC